MGAEDTATLNAVINTVASSFAIIVPYLGFWLRQVTGSWLPIMMCSVCTKALSGVLFVRWASVTPARKLLEAEDREKEGPIAVST